WLASEAPTPPIVSILKNYLPSLTGPGGSIPIPSKRLRRIVDDAVEYRNGIAHAGRSPNMSVDERKALIDAVRDLLYMFDVASGEPWAVMHVSRETRTELGW